MLNFVNWRAIQTELTGEQARATFRQLATAHIEATRESQGAERHIIDASKNVFAGLLWSTVARLGTASTDLTEAFQHDLAELQETFVEGIAHLRQQGGLPLFAAAILDAAGERERDSYFQMCFRFLDKTRSHARVGA